jgi:hypothetical protein
MSCLLLLLTLSDPEPFEPPAGGRPDSFRGAVGLFRIEASLDTPFAAVGKPLRYTVRITADPAVPVHSPPTRPEVEKDAEFKRHFQIEPADPPQKVDEKKRVWEFYYQLTPKPDRSREDMAVLAAGAVGLGPFLGAPSLLLGRGKEVPELPFCFFNPRFGNDPLGYQELAAKPIAITVSPAPPSTPPVEGSPIDAFPESIRWLADTDQLLARHEPWTPPGTTWMILLLVAPPLVSLAWLVVWQRLYPNAARRAKLRRSRAARQALKTLHTARSAQGTKLAERIAGIVALYLGQRFDLPAQAPTPAEVDGFLRGLQLPDELRQQAAALLETCDALRFSAVPPAVSGSLADTAEKLILDLETFSWSSHPC